MADQRGGGITWTDTTWNCIRGCSRVSAGCANCYAERVAGRFSAAGQPYHGLAVLDDRGARWTGEVAFVEKHLDDPLRWTRPRRIFVNSMSDLFHEKLDVNDIARVFGVMGAATHHQFQVLTKRSARMRKLLNAATFRRVVADEVASAWWRKHGENKEISGKYPDVRRGAWPLPNVWLGVSVEHQEAADERIPDLLETPAAIRWLSVEPLIGPVRLRLSDADRFVKLHWVVVGGESGPGARPMHPDWARAIREECLCSHTPFHLKQWGEWSPTGSGDDLRTIDVGEGLTAHRMIRLGKKAAGRELDGRTWDEYPEARS